MRSFFIFFILISNVWANPGKDLIRQPVQEFLLRYHERGKWYLEAFATDANGEFIWPATNAWNADWEKKFSAWVAAGSLKFRFIALDAGILP